jgi:hypothetical protein
MKPGDAKMPVKFTTVESDLSKSIASIARRGKALDNDIWAAAVGTLALAQKGGNLTLFGDLVNAMPRGSRAQTLIAWAQSCVPVVLVNGKPKIDQIRVKDGEFERDRSDWKIQDLANSPWFEYDKNKTDEKPEYSLDQLVAMLEKLAKGKRPNSSEAAMDGASVALKAIKAAVEVGDLVSA